MPGDEIDIEVWAFNQGGISTGTSRISSTNLVTALANAFVPGGSGTDLYTQTNTIFSGVSSYLTGGGSSGSSRPFAFLNYIVFDNNFNRVASGHSRVSSITYAKHLLSLNNVNITQKGYMYIWVSNESNQNQNTYFDDLKVTHHKGAILQEDHYYPFGMNINALSSTAPLSKPNKYKFNGNEEQTEFNLGLSDFNARFYDPQLGRFIQVDPLADYAVQLNMTPYQFGWNNPVKYDDPTGECPVCVIPWVIGAIEALTTTAAVGTAAYTGYKLGDELSEGMFDRSKLRTGTLSVQFEGNNMHPKHDPNKPPNWNTAKRIARVATAVGLIAELSRQMGESWTEKDIQKAVEDLSHEEVQAIIGSLRTALNRIGDVQQMTDLQLFGAMNPELSESAATYGIMKDMYGLERGLSEEQRKAEEEQRNKGRQAQSLLNKAENGELEAGVYTWNGSNWVKNE